MKQIKRWHVFVSAAILMAGTAAQTVSAQSNPPGPAPIPAYGGGRGGAGIATVCSTTDYTDVAAKALGLSDTDLRVALVSGKSIADLATSKNVTLQTVQDALTAARKADLDQALKDGLITQAQHDGITARMSAQPNALVPQATEQADATAQAAPGNGRVNPSEGVPPLGDRRPGFGLGVPAYNVVNREIVAAQALGMSCPDLVKAMQAGQTVAQVATSKNVTTQTVSDALTTAYKNAAALDVKEGLITQAQSDARLSRIQTQVTDFINNQRPQGPGGRGGFPGFGQPGNGPRGNGQPGDGQHGPDNGQPGNPPNAQPTATVQSS